MGEIQALRFPRFHIYISNKHVFCASFKSYDPVATAAHAATTGHMGMSTRPDPERSGAVGIHPQAKTQAMDPSRQTRSSYGSPHLPVGALVLLSCIALSPSPENIQVLWRL